MNGLEKFRAYVKRLQSETGLDMTGIARKAGLAVSTVARPLTDGYVGTPSTTTIGKLESAFGIPFHGDGALQSPTAAKASGQTEGLLPILGGARGGDIETIFFDQGTVQGWRPCPPSLAGVPGAFAVYIVGESMLPKFEPGAMVYVDPNLPPSTGKYVVIDLSDNRAVVKQYVRQDAERIWVREFNPAREFEILKTEIKRIYRIVSSEEP